MDGAGPWLWDLPRYARHEQVGELPGMAHPFHFPHHTHTGPPRRGWGCVGSLVPSQLMGTPWAARPPSPPHPPGIESGHRTEAHQPQATLK